MNCSKCSTANPEDARFCLKCGALIAEGKVGKWTRLGPNRRALAVLSYLLGFFTGLLVLLVEDRNVYVRFHAVQSVAIFATLAVLAVLFRLLAMMPSYISIVFMVLMWVVAAVGVVSWLLLMFKAARGDRFLLLWFGEFAERETYGRVRG